MSRGLFVFNTTNTLVIARLDRAIQ